MKQHSALSALATVSATLYLSARGGPAPTSQTEQPDAGTAAADVGTSKDTFDTDEIGTGIAPAPRTLEKQEVARKAYSP